MFGLSLIRKCSAVIAAAVLLLVRKWDLDVVVVARNVFICLFKIKLFFKLQSASELYSILSHRERQKMGPPFKLATNLIHSPQRGVVEENLFRVSGQRLRTVKMKTEPGRLPLYFPSTYNRHWPKRTAAKNIFSQVIVLGTHTEDNCESKYNSRYRDRPRPIPSSYKPMLGSDNLETVVLVTCLTRSDGWN